VPEDVIVTFAFGRPDSDPTASTFLIISIPSTTSPKTTCLPSSQLVTTVVMKNYPHAVSMDYTGNNQWGTYLRAIRVGPSICHGKETWLGMPKLEVLICNPEISQTVLANTHETHA